MCDSYYPFTRAEAAQLVDAWGSSIGRVKGCADCEILPSCCAECHDSQMVENIKRLGSKVREFRKLEKQGADVNRWEFVQAEMKRAGIDV